jgi:RimJ/RimL family protein N-acetyltransferase
MMSSLKPLPQRVTSERLLIRPTTFDDIPYLQRWWNDPSVMDPVGNIDGMQYDDDDMVDWYHRYIAGQPYARHFVVCLRKPVEQPIGEFYISCDDRPADVSFSILIGETALWGRGYACEAVQAYAGALFASRTCEEMRMDVRRDNSRAIAMGKCAGFEVEHVWANGRVQTMALTHQTYERQQASVRF